MSIQKKSLISTLKTAKKANVASAPLAHVEGGTTEPRLSKTAGKMLAKSTAKQFAKSNAKVLAKAMTKVYGKSTARAYAKV
jgi:predicted transcriptional regulator